MEHMNNHLKMLHTSRNTLARWYQAAYFFFLLPQFYPKAFVLGNIPLKYLNKRAGIKKLPEK